MVSGLLVSGSWCYSRIRSARRHDWSAQRRGAGRNTRLRSSVEKSTHPAGCPCVEVLLVIQRKDCREGSRWCKSSRNHEGHGPRQRRNLVLPVTSRAWSLFSVVAWNRLVHQPAQNPGDARGRRMRQPQMVGDPGSNPGGASAPVNMPYRASTRILVRDIGTPFRGRDRAGL